MVKKIETNAYQAKGIAVRTVDFDFVLDKKRFTVLASPNPTYLDGDIGDKLIESCIDAGYKTFIPLEYSAKLVKLKTVKVTGEEMYVSDFSAPVAGSFLMNTVGMQDYDDIGERVLSSMELNGGLFLHCGAGHGRSGAFLAGLKLMEIVQKRQANDSGFIYTVLDLIEKGPTEDVSFYLSGRREEIKVPQIIAQAIKEVRVMHLFDNRGNPKADDSVETIAQIDFLKDLARLYADELQKTLTLTGDDAPLPDQEETDKGDNTSKGLDLSSQSAAERPALTRESIGNVRNEGKNSRDDAPSGPGVELANRGDKSKP